MKLARALLAAVAVSALAACSGDSPTAPSATPAAGPSQDLICDIVLPDGTIECRSPQLGSGG